MPKVYAPVTAGVNRYHTALRIIVVAPAWLLRTAASASAVALLKLLLPKRSMPADTHAGSGGGVTVIAIGDGRFPRGTCPPIATK